ncbi:MAG: DUF1573 domain-containing protein [Chthoniobacterales bacterium]
MKTSLCALALLLSLSLPVRAALQWESLVAELHPKISDKETVAHFKYKNTGEQPVKITAVKPSCGCTTAAPPQEPIAPGASGEITATFHIGDRVGMQTKTIHVQTDETPNANTTLTLKADVPKLLEITPAFLYWSKKEPGIEPRYIDVKVGKDFKVTKLTVTSTDPEVKVAAEKVPDSTNFRIKVTPPKTNRPINAALKIVPDFPKDTPKNFYANVHVAAHVDATEPAAAASAAATAAAPSPAASPAP